MNRLDLDPDVYELLDPINDFIMELKSRIAELEEEKSELEKECEKLNDQILDT